MKRIKHFMAWLLMFMMVFMVFPLQQVTWAANSHTSAEAGQWARNKIGGDARDWDGVYGVQCADFIMWYTKGFWGVDYAPQGDASAYSWNSMPSGWIRIQYSSGFVAKPGDIAVWTYCDGSNYGHIGVVTSADSSGMTIAEQWSSTGVAAAQSGKVQSRYFKYNDGKNTFYGVVRPLYSDAPAISIDTTINENSYIFRSNSVYLNASIDKNGGNVNAATNSNTQAQKWNVKKSGNAYQIIAQNSLSGRVLNVYTDGTSANGMNVTLWAVTGHQTQLWQFEKKGEGYRIHPSDNLNVSLAVVSGDDVKLTYNSDESNQIWYMETSSSGPAPAPTIVPDKGVITAYGDVTINAIMTKVGTKFDWYPNNNPLGYRIYRSTSMSDEGISITDFPIKGGEHVDVNVEPYTQYYYTIRKVLSETSFDSTTMELTPEVQGSTGEALAIVTGEIIEPEADSGPTKHFILMEIDNPIMITNTEALEIDPGRGTVPTTVNGRTLVPIRAIAEEMGGTVGWNDATRTVIIDCMSRHVEMTLDSKIMTVDSAAQEMDIAAQTINGRTVLPVRFVGEAVGCVIEWIGSTKQIIVVFYR